MATMTNDQYIKNSNVCPYCKSKAVSAEECNVNGTSVTVDVECNSCRKEWIDIYALMGYQHCS